MDLKILQGRYHRSSEPVKGVLLLEFNRAPVNAFHDDMWIELKTIIERASQDSKVRAIVLASALEKHFTAGLDLTAQINLADPALDPARKAIALRDHILDFQAAISSLALCRQPVIAATHGTAVGLAIDLISACDIRIAASCAVFAIAEVNVGLAADIGTLQRFPKVMGNDSRARELALTGRRFGAEEAMEIGFLSRVVHGGRAEVVAAAIDTGRQIAEKSPIAVISTKHLMNHARDHTVEEGLAYTAAWNMAMLQSDDTASAMQATLSRRRADFPPFDAKPDHSKGKL